MSKLKGLCLFIDDLLKKNTSIDLLSIALKVVWLYSWTILKCSQVLELLFRKLIHVNNGNISKCLIPIIKNTNGNIIKIVDCFNEAKTVNVNKFLLFLRYYWNDCKKNTDYDFNHFDFRQFIRFFGDTVFYCSYILTDDNPHIKRFSISPKKDQHNAKVKKYIKSIIDSANLTNITESMQLREEDLLFNAVRFD